MNTNLEKPNTINKMEKIEDINSSIDILTKKVNSLNKEIKGFPLEKRKEIISSLKGKTRALVAAFLMLLSADAAYGSEKKMEIGDPHKKIEMTNPDKEKKENISLKKFETEKEFSLGIGNLNEKSRKNIEEAIVVFIDKLSDTEIESILSGNVLVNASGEASEEKVHTLTMEDGTLVKNNKELAEYRAKELIKIFLQKLQEKGFNIENIKISISTPETGVSEKNRRFASLEFIVNLEKNTKNILEKLAEKGDIVAFIKDISSSIDKKERKQQETFLAEHPEIINQELLGSSRGEEKTLKTLEKIYKILKEKAYQKKENGGIIILSTDELDASLRDTNHPEFYKKQMEGELDLFKNKFNIEVYAQIFDPNSDNFTLVNLTKNPSLLDPGKDLRILDKSKKSGEILWKKAKEVDISDEILKQQNNENEDTYFVSIDDFNK